MMTTAWDENMIKRFMFGFGSSLRSVLNQIKKWQKTDTKSLQQPVSISSAVISYQSARSVIETFYKSEMEIVIEAQK